MLGFNCSRPSADQYHKSSAIPLGYPGTPSLIITLLKLKLLLVGTT